MQRHSHSRSRLLFASVLCTGLSLALTGCPTPNVVPEQTETLIAGGSRIAVSPDGRLSVDFTRNAIAEGTLVTVGFAEITPKGLVGRAYRLGPDGLAFDGPVTVRFKVEGYAPRGTLVLANLDGETPAVIQGSTFDPVAGTITGNLKHFSSYGAIDVSAPCAGLACGEACDPCASGDPACVPMGATTVCDANGACVPGNPQTVSCGGRSYDPCAGLACGETCSLCPPGATGCVEPAVLLTCNESGLCGMNQPTCGAYAPCEAKACGESCSLCPPDDPSCVEPAVALTCDAFGACLFADPALVDCGIAPPPPSECQSDAECGPGEVCVGSSWCPGCASGDPNCDGACYAVGSCEPAPDYACAGLSCGDACAPCASGDPSCNSTSPAGICDAFGACVQTALGTAIDCGGTVPPPSCSADADCGVGEACLPMEWCPPCTNSSPPCAMPCYAGLACQPTQTDCAGKVCGDVCALPDGSTGFCDGNGGCAASTSTVPSCGGAYQPCANLACGDTCTLCDPADPACAETAVVKFCDAGGGCGYAYPDCGGSTPPTSECQSDSDCSASGTTAGAYCVIETWCPACASDPVTPCAAPCVAYGVCQSTAPYDPCRGKICGASCTLCDPADPTCTETAVQKSCDASGSCSSRVPACGQAGDFCGGFANIQCAPGYTCVDDPTDSCDPATGADCAGLCEADPCLGGPVGCTTPCSVDADCAAGQTCVSGSCK